MKLKEWDPVIIIEKNIDSDTYYGLYAGKDLSLKYPFSLHFWLWVNRDKIWERHAFDYKVKFIYPKEYDMKKFLANIFEAKNWTISS